MKIFLKKNALITGATGGIGYEIAKQMAKMGVNLCLTSTNKTKLESVKKKLLLINQNIKIINFVCDLSNSKNIDKLYYYVKKNFINLDFLFNTAAVFAPKKINNENINDINKSFQINVISPIYLSKLFSQDMKKKNFGRIVNIGSSSSYLGFKYTSIYCSTKHAILGFSRSLHDELKSYNVRVFCVSPGTVDTKMANKIKNQNKDTFIDPQEVAQIIIHILSYDKNMIIDEIRLNRISIQ